MYAGEEEKWIKDRALGNTASNINMTRVVAICEYTLTSIAKERS